MSLPNPSPEASWSLIACAWADDHAGDLRGKTLDVIGVGRTGSFLSRKAIAAFQLRVLGNDPYVDACTLAGHGVQKMDKLEEMLPQCERPQVSRF